MEDTVMHMTLAEAFEEEKLFKKSNKQKGTKKIDMDQYFIVPHKYVVLELTPTELLALSLIMGMIVNSEKKEFYGSMNYVASRIGCRIPTASKIVNGLAKKGYFIKSEEQDENGCYRYTVPEEDSVEVQDKDEEKLHEKIKELRQEKYDAEICEIIGYLNMKLDKRFSANSATTRRLITARFNDGYKIEDFITVIDNKIRTWHGVKNGDFEGDKYLKPDTLFGNKFDYYLNEVDTTEKNKPRKVFYDNVKLEDI